jgi:diacylglycerol kinase family enzyme
MTRPDEVLIFANPIAGRGRGQAIARRLHDRLRADGYAPRVLLQRPDLIPDEELAGDGMPARAAIAIGGDGTLRAVADRLHRVATDRAAPPLAASSRDASRSPPPLLVVPLGTANLMGRHLSIPWDETNFEEHVSTAIRQRRVVELDAGAANGKLFLLMAGVGFDAHIVHELDRMREGPIDFASYLVPAALALTMYDYPPLTVTVDGNEVFAAAPAVAFVGNIPEYGTGFPMLPHARPDDGVLDVCVLPCANRGDVLRWFLLAAAGEHVQAEGAVYVKGRSVRIDSSQSAPVQVDGDAAGHTPVRIELLPVRLPFIVP